MNKKALSFVLSSVMVFSSVSMAFAATGDVLNADGTLFAPGKQMNTSSALQKQVNAQQSQYLYEYDGKAYTMTDANAAYAAAGSMDNFAQEIAKKEPVSDVNAQLAIQGVKAVTTTKLQITFNKAVDGVKAENFQIPGITVQAAELSESKTVATLSVTGAVVKTGYTLTATGLKVNGETITDLTKEFTMPAADELFTPALTIDKTALKSDGASQALVKFELKDAEGNVLVDAEDVQIKFIATVGNFAEDTVAVEKGIASNLLTSEFLKEAKTVPLYGMVSEAADKNLIGLTATTTVVMSPNPEEVVETVGASLTAAEANQADRVIAFFNKEVNVADFLNDDATVTIADQVNNDQTGGRTVTVPAIGYLPVEGNAKAIQVLVDVENGAFLTDNTNILVTCVDNTESIPVNSKSFFTFTDARKPAMLSVKTESLSTLKIVFSEAIDATTAAIEANWTIDGKLLNSEKWGTTVSASAIVGQLVKTGNRIDDLRSVVTITLGKDAKGNQIYFAPGNHSIQAANIGDWAYNTDKTNVMNTQTLDFVISADDTKPNATVEVQSPEQWVVEFNKEIGESDASLAAALQLQKLNKSTGEYETVTSGAIAAVDDANLDIVVSKIIGESRPTYLVQTDYDWTEVYDTATSKKNYFNDSYRLHIDAGKITAAANGKKNDEINLALEGSMLTPDTLSPSIVSMKDDGSQIYHVTMSEPVKLSTTANAEGATLAQGQATLAAVTAEFIEVGGEKRTIQGTVDISAFVDEYNKVLKVTPNSTLTPGDWELVVRDIADDIGNKAPTATTIFTVEGTPQVDSEFKILWTAADGNSDFTDGFTATSDTAKDAIYVKFSKAVAINGSQANVLNTANYTVNGQKLPQGSQILANIEGFDGADEVVDSITILLPDGTIQDLETTTLNVSSYLQSAKGEALANGGEKKLTFEIVNLIGIASDSATVAGELANVKSSVNVASPAALGDVVTVTNGAIGNSVVIDDMEILPGTGADYLTWDGTDLKIAKNVDLTEETEVFVLVTLKLNDAIGIAKVKIVLEV